MGGGQGAIEHPTMHRTVLPTKNYLAPSVCSVATEKPGHMLVTNYFLKSQWLNPTIIFLSCYMSNMGWQSALLVLVPSGSLAD